MIPILLSVLLVGRASSPEPDIGKMVRDIDSRNIERIVRKLVSFGTRNTLSSQTDSKRGIGAARDWLYAEMKSCSPRLQVELQSFEQRGGPRIPRPTRLTNIVATLKGEQPQSADRIYVVSGHYDSMCGSPTDSERDAPGADDDASGTGAVMEMARVMSKYRFDATIVFMAVAGEEQGLLGSTYFAEQAKQKGLRIEAMFANDIIGSSHGGNGVHDDRSVRVFSEGVPSTETEAEARIRRSVGGENDSPSRQLARFIKEAGERYVRGMKVNLIYRRDRYGRGGDHIPFLERGFPAVRFCEPNEDFRHQHQDVRTENGVVYGDLPEFVDYAYTAQVARVNAAALAELALAPAPPKGVAFVNRRLSHDTELQWSANTESDIVCYEVVWRDTASSTWTTSKSAGGATSYTARGISRDNLIFGVRALDRAGHRSPVSVAQGARSARQ